MPGMSKTLLFLQAEPRDVAKAVRTVMKNEEFNALPSAESALAATSATTSKPETSSNAEVIIISREGEWTVMSNYKGVMDMALPTATAGETAAEGWIMEPGEKRGQVKLWKISGGQISEEAEPVTEDTARIKLKAVGVDERLLGFVPKEHLAEEDTKLGRHDDVLLGFERRGGAAEGSAASRPKTEVERALGAKSAETEKSYSLDEFLAMAVGHERVRAIAKAQITEQLRRDGFMGPLEIIDPQPEGHYCDSYTAESYSFTSNGPYLWFDWECEEACEAVLPEEKAFPSCDLRFALEKTEEL